MRAVPGRRSGAAGSRRIPRRPRKRPSKLVLMADELLDSVEEEEVDEETLQRRARREAALRHVRKMGDPVLRTKALEVPEFDARLREQVEWMREVMEEAYGVGLAATQVGLLERILVYRVEPDGPIAAVINPRVQW